MQHPFHLAIPVADLSTARKFYSELLGCAEGRSSDTWVDFNLYGHQLVIHQVQGYHAQAASNPVDAHDVPIPHFGVILSMEKWHQLAEKVRCAGVEFIIAPYVRFQGQPGEQATMFFRDPSGNALEFKAFAELGQIFAK